jgi:hypothetical protein
MAATTTLERDQEKAAQARIRQRNLLSRSLNELEEAHDRFLEAHRNVQQVSLLLVDFGVGTAEAATFDALEQQVVRIGAAVGFLERVLAEKRDTFDLSL